jgi:hypothetical protein
MASAIRAGKCHPKFVRATIPSVGCKAELVQKELAVKFFYSSKALLLIWSAIVNSLLLVMTSCGEYIKSSLD